MRNLPAPNRRKPNRGTIGRRHALRLGAAGLVLAAGVLAGAATPGHAETPQDAGVFLQSLTTRAIEQLTNSSVPVDVRKARFRTLFRETFDVAAIGRFVLGRYGRNTPKPVLEEFLLTFEDVMVERFAPQFAGYGDTRFTVSSVHPVDNKKQFIVSSAITPPDSETAVKIDWRVHQRDGGFKVLDIIGEGVSMALTLRAEYGSVLKSSGGKVDRLIVLLRERMSPQAAAAN